MGIPLVDYETSRHGNRIRKILAMIPPETQQNAEPAIDYADKSLCSERKRRKPGIIRFIALVAGLTIIVTTAVQIEVLNWMTGGILPSRGGSEGLKTDGHWRSHPWTTESKWRQMFGPRDENFKPVTRPLTIDEQTQMNTSIRKARANNQLMGTLSTFGCAQYILVPGSFFVALFLWLDSQLRRWQRTFGAIGLCITIAAGILMFCRAYYLVLD